jgi:hypothetical protein
VVEKALRNFPQFDRVALYLRLNKINIKCQRIVEDVKKQKIYRYFPELDEKINKYIDKYSEKYKSQIKTSR